MLLSDHINLSGANPLIGEPSEARFVPMTDAHDPDLRARLRAAAEAAGVPLGEGVYAWFSGPSFETPAEIRMARVLGADAVGMSTVPEVILARFLGLKVAAISTVTNMGAGLSDEAISTNTPRPWRRSGPPSSRRCSGNSSAACDEGRPRPRHLTSHATARMS